MQKCANKFLIILITFPPLKKKNLLRGASSALPSLSLSLSLIGFDSTRSSSVSFRAFGRVIQGNPVQLRVATRSERDRRQIRESRSV